MTEVELNFGNAFAGELITNTGKLRIGTEDGDFRPYELLAGALGSCLFATFQEIIEKMRLDFENCHLDVKIEKRETVPTTAKWIQVTGTIKGADKEKRDKYERAFKLATEHCSIYQTMSGVAEMEWTLELI